jgi:hypothetical protein
LAVTCGEVDMQAVIDTSATGGRPEDPNVAGRIALVADGGPVTIGGSVLAVSKDGEAGPIELTGTSVTVQQFARIDAGGLSPGAIALYARDEEGAPAGDVVVAGSLLSNGIGTGTGGSVEIEACNVAIEGSGLLSAKGGQGGSNTVTAHTDLAIAGSLTAEAGGANVLVYRNGLSVTGSIRPASIPVQNPALSPCP